MAKTKLAPVHPGDILLHDFLEPLGLTPYALAKAIGVQPPRVNDIVRHTRSITADTALRLGKYFGTTAQFWMNLQAQYDLEIAERAAGKLLSKIPSHPTDKRGTLVKAA